MARFDDHDDGCVVLGGSKPKMRVRASTGALVITVSGSAQHPRDPRIAVAERGARWETFTPPAGKLWCSHPHHHGLDENGQDDGGWVPRNQFTDDPRNSSGKHSYCNTCRARDARRMRALERETRQRR